MGRAWSIDDQRSPQWRRMEAKLDREQAQDEYEAEMEARVADAKSEADVYRKALVAVVKATSDSQVWMLVADAIKRGDEYR